MSPGAPTLPERDARPAKLVARTPVEEAHQKRMLALVEYAQSRAEAAGVALQYEFGPAVALIAGCQQFLRLHRGGEAPGTVELMLPPADKEALAAGGFTLLEPFGQVFRMFGWTRVDPMEAESVALEAAVDAAFERARTLGAPKL